MKNFLKAVGNFFKKIGLFIWKYLKVCWVYIKENAWIQPIVIVALIFGLVFGIQGIVDGVEKIKADNESQKEESSKAFTKLTMGEVVTKLNNSEDFILFIGAHDCAYCVMFQDVVSKYVKSTGNMIYYVDIHDSSDTSIDANTLLAWAEMLEDIDTRDFDGSLSTPTTVVVRGGQFADAKSGAQGLEGGADYLNFTKFVEGEYVGKIESSN